MRDPELWRFVRISDVLVLFHNGIHVVEQVQLLDRPQTMYVVQLSSY